MKIDKNIRKIHKIPSLCRERYLVLDNEGGDILVQAGINHAGISELVAGYQICDGEPLQRHMVIFTNAGHGYIATRQREYRVSAGELLIVPAGDEVIFGVEGAKWDIVWFYLKPIERWQQLQARGIWLCKTELIEKINRVSEWVLNEFQALEHGAGDVSLAEKYSELLLALMTTSFGMISGIANSILNLRLNELVYKIQQSLNKKWSIEVMAAEMKLTPITLQRLIKKRFNTTARQLLIGFRMKQAELMLKNSGYPLKIIAEQLGYSNEFVFSSAFRRHHGISPGAYRGR
ncbi:MAG: AraC family transcriptional regulator [Victivallaceae bacterium]|nr:AraC family transcriptional regulator [Victivallaceae bacterium]